MSLDFSSVTESLSNDFGEGVELNPSSKAAELASIEALGNQPDAMANIVNHKWDQQLSLGIFAARFGEDPLSTVLVIGIQLVDKLLKIEAIALHKVLLLKNSSDVFANIDAVNFGQGLLKPETIAGIKRNNFELTFYKPGESLHIESLVNGRIEDLMRLNSNIWNALENKLDFNKSSFIAVANTYSPQNEFFIITHQRLGNQSRVIYVNLVTFEGLQPLLSEMQIVFRRNIFLASPTEWSQYKVTSFSDSDSYSAVGLNDTETGFSIESLLASLQSQS
ncbi:MAG: hypothetical protein Q9M91_01820 [Candidatus Dojkabacteria bacterium]|nr:hypothetical protein [Candidatus Dojkabacteria bacterium]MDQ7020562.1 hypothetical protein [Candidatus Dojkabacteria bacterium]